MVISPEMQRNTPEPFSENVAKIINFITWKTVTVAQSKESKFFLSLIPVSGSTNLHPNRFIPKILKYFRGFR